MLPKIRKRSSAMTRSLALLAATIVAALGALTVNPNAAQAAYSEIGPYLTADVTCDSFSNTISVLGRFGAGPRYADSYQYLRVRYWALNVRTNRSFWLSPNGSWSTFVHRPWNGSSYEFLATNVPGFDRLPITGPDTEGYYGKFHVYVDYQWYTTMGWVGFYNIRTNSYGSGWGPTPYCYL
jgi:hypothetical protein